MQYNFDEIINREGTACYKYDLRKKIFGRDDIIPMWVADMDFNTPPFIIDAIRKRLEHEVFGYSFRPDSFYEAIINWLKHRHNWPVKKEWISFSPGVVPALNMIIMAFTQPGDKVIVQPPVYFPFYSAVTNHNRLLVRNPLVLNNERYEMDYEDLERKIDKRVKMLILCSPHNPTGNVWKKDELEKLIEICIKNNILILSDEIHSDIIFSGNKHLPAAGLSDKITQQIITLMAPSKTFNIAGLSTSFVICQNPALLKKYNNMLDALHIAQGNIFGNVALEAAYNHGNEWLDQLIQYLQDNLNFAIHYLVKKIPGIHPIKPEATYLLWLDCRKQGMNDKELNDLLSRKAGLGLSAGSLFGPEGQGFVRMNIGCPRFTLHQALDRLYNALMRNRKSF